MSLGVNVSLGPGNTVLDGDPAPIKWGTTPPPPEFSVHVYCVQTVGWIKVPVATAVDLGPGDIVSDGDPAPLERGTTTAPSFRPMSIVAKRSPISATAEHLLLLNCCSYCDFVLERFTVIGLYSMNSVQYYPCCHFKPCLLCGRTGVDSMNVFTLCLMRI